MEQLCNKNVRNRIVDHVIIFNSISHKNIFRKSK